MERQTNYSLLERFSDGMKDCTFVKFLKPTSTRRKHSISPRLNFNLWRSGDRETWVGALAIRHYPVQYPTSARAVLPIFVSHPTRPPSLPKSVGVYSQ